MQDIEISKREKQQKCLIHGKENNHKENNHHIIVKESKHEFENGQRECETGKQNVKIDLDRITCILFPVTKWERCQSNFISLI